MSERTTRAGGGSHHLATSDVGRRILLHRTGLGLSLSDVATRAGVSVPYLDYLESEPSHPSPDTLRALARVLRTSEEDLLGGTQGQAPGHGPPAALSHLGTVGADECWQLVGDRGVGRIAFPVGQDVLVVPINYTASERVLSVRTDTATALAHHVHGHARVSLEVDRLDEATSGGWSVLLAGPARRHDVGADAADDRVPPGGRVDRSLVLTLRPDVVSGRRLAW